MLRKNFHQPECQSLRPLSSGNQVVDEKLSSTRGSKSPTSQVGKPASRGKMFIDYLTVAGSTTGTRIRDSANSKQFLDALAVNVFFSLLISEHVYLAGISFSFPHLLVEL